MDRSHAEPRRPGRERPRRLRVRRFLPDVRRAGGRASTRIPVRAGEDGMAEWFDSLAEGWPTPEGAWIADVYDDLEDAWLYAQTEFKLWLAARLAPGWPERVRLLAATARAIDVNLSTLARNVDFPLDAIPDVVGTLSRVSGPDRKST